MTERAIQKFSEPGRDLLQLAPTEIQNKLKAIDDFQKIIKHSLVQDLDYGIIPGTQKPTLYKGGAEKIAKLLNLSDSYEIVEKIEDWKTPFFSYTVRCTLTEMGSGTVVCSYLASCNSMESKYRYRWVPQWKLTKEQAEDPNIYREKRGNYTFYRFDNDDIYSQLNTLLKMAEKRALVSAAVSVGRLSLVFTVDLEDYRPTEDDAPPPNGTPDSSKAEQAPYKGEAAGSTPAPAKKTKPTIVEERYNDDPYPPITEFTLGDGTRVKVSKFKAYELYDKIKQAIGEERYYAVLNSCKYENKKAIPDEELHTVYALLTGEWKKVKGSRK